ncbi:hypothetical protein [Mucilaginibacter sp. dw_454]|uniref:hypothetical protein n=1 Tax=Mucilaginibacter sp. dw_454 TaxID=2720079 RepID=UPI001BD1D5C0|nr:hypothetical protein [Mucilaginibacter sp. dw_454]
MFKYLVKIILPPLFAFWSFAVLIKFSPYFHHVDTGSLGEDSIDGLISYYKIFAPGQIAIALLTQILIGVPLWRKIVASRAAAISIFSVLVIVCAIFAFGLARIIWDPATGKRQLIDIGCFMTAVQLYYWTVDFLILYLLDWKLISDRKAESKSKTEKES